MLNPRSPFRHTDVFLFEYFLIKIENDMVATIPYAVDILGKSALGMSMKENKRHDGPLEIRFPTTDVSTLTTLRAK
jgi:hypothetical protein